MGGPIDRMDGPSRMAQENGKAINKGSIYLNLILENQVFDLEEMMLNLKGPCICLFMHGRKFTKQS